MQHNVHPQHGHITAYDTAHSTQHTAHTRSCAAAVQGMDDTFVQAQTGAFLLGQLFAMGGATGLKELVPRGL